MVPHTQETFNLSISGPPTWLIPFCRYCHRRDRRLTLYARVIHQLARRARLVISLRDRQVQRCHAHSKSRPIRPLSPACTNHAPHCCVRCISFIYE